MSAPASTTPMPFLRPAIDSRPPAYRFGVAGRIDLGDAVERQPSLLDVLRELQDDPSGPPRPRGVRIHRDTAPGACQPAPGLPEPGAWTAVLGLAIGQALVGARPVGQLDCWVEPRVLADLKCAARVRTRAATRTVAVAVVSVRVQLPTPSAVEATIGLRMGSRSSVFAARLEAYGQRWVCTVLVRPEPVTDRRPDRDTA